MAKKSYNYFDKFNGQMALCKQAAGQLADMLENYTDVTARAERIHVTEHEADNLLHEIMQELNRSFITPIDREDIVSLASALDDIVDSIEDVANLFDMLSIHEVRPEALDMAKLIFLGCDMLHKAVSEFANFKGSTKKVNELVIEVNHAEESGDIMHRNIIKSLYLHEKDAIELMKWKEIFDTMEDVLDNLEDVADLLDGLVIKNS